MFNNLQPVPTDPILGLVAEYKADTNPNKVDLSVGVYKNEQGQTPVLKAVKKAENVKFFSGLIDNRFIVQGSC